MPVRIQSFLRKEDETLVPIQEWDAVIADPDYLEGALDLTVNGVHLITPSMWDYVDQMWAYIFNVLEELTTHESAHVYFPDQPIRLEMEKTIPGMIKISISSRSGKFNNSVQVNEGRFARKILDEGEKFFLHMQKIDPENRNRHEEEVERFRNLRLAYSE